MTSQIPKLIPTFSPFEPAFATEINEVPFSFREQFLHAPEDPFDIVLRGHLDIWFRPKWLTPLFFLLEKTGILVSEIGENIPVTLTVRAKYDHNNLPVHYWNRTFQFKTERYFNTILPYDFDKEEVGDFIGKSKLVYIVWKTEFLPPTKFTINTKACALHLKGKYLWLPDWLWKPLFGMLRCTQKTNDLESDKFSINLIIRHPWFGDVFGYKGKFKTTRKSK